MAWEQDGPLGRPTLGRRSPEQRVPLPRAKARRSYTRRALKTRNSGHLTVVTSVAFRGTVRGCSIQTTVRKSATPVELQGSTCTKRTTFQQHIQPWLGERDRICAMQHLAPGERRNINVRAVGPPARDHHQPEYDAREQLRPTPLHNQRHPLPVQRVTQVDREMELQSHLADLVDTLLTGCVWDGENPENRPLLSPPTREPRCGT